MDNKFKIPFMNACIRKFANKYMLTLSEAFAYLQRYRAIQFLDEYYEAEHLQSIDDTIDDLILICQQNGGNLA